MVAIVLLVVSVVIGWLGFALSLWWFIGAFLALAAFVALAYWKKLGWPGLSEYLGPPESKDRAYERGKTAWDWAQMIVIPLVILLVGSLIASSQQTVSNNALDAQHKNDVHMAQEQMYESQLSTYLTNMAGLLQQPNAHTDNVDIRNIARADTITVLNELVTDPNLITDQQLLNDLQQKKLTVTAQPNSKRKARILQFLYESGLINRDPNAPPFVNLAGADFSYADLQDAQLNGADLAGAIFSYADMSNAALNSADLSEAKLDNINLYRVHLTYAQIVGGSMSGSKVNLSNADLSGADLLDTNLTGVSFKDADITGTVLPPNTPTTGAKSQSTWKLIQVNSIATIAFNDKTAHRLIAYGALDLNTSKLQLSYGPQSNMGTTVVLLPAIWSQENCPGSGNYCEGAPITISSTQLVVQSSIAGVVTNICPDNFPVFDGQITTDASASGANFVLCLNGTVSGLQVDLAVQFLPPTSDTPDTMTVEVTAKTVDGPPISLSPKIDAAAFRPVVLRSIYFPATPKLGSQFETQSASVNNAPVPFPQALPATQIAIVSIVNAQTFGLLGNNQPFGPVRNAPTIMITMIQPGPLSVGGEIQSSDDPNKVNIGLWAYSQTVLDAWSYSIVASNPFSQ